MNKRLLCVLLYFLVPCLVIIPVYATITPTIIYPDGNELVYGVITPIFTVSDSTSDTNFYADLYLSYSPLEKNFLIADDLNLLVACDFKKGVNYTTKNSPPVVVASGEYSMEIGQLDANIVLILYNGTTGTWSSFYWDGTNWLASTAHAGLPAGFFNGFGFTKIGSTYYLFTGSITPVGYDWNGSGWTVNPAISSGLNVGVQGDTYRFFDVGGLTYLLVGGGAPFLMESWKFSGTTWSKYNYYSSNIAAFVSENMQWDIFFDGLNTLQLIASDYYPTTAHFSIIGFTFDTSTGLWGHNFEYSDDLNTAANNKDAAEPIIIGKISSDNYFLIYDTTAGWKGFYKLNEFDYDTSTAASCSYPFDTSNYPNGQYFFDVNAINGLSTSGSDSSHDPFRILNWGANDISCSCVSNCSSCVLDVNSFIVTPTKESNDIEIKITNFGAVKTVGYKIRNSDNSGKQYKIYTADSTNYADGNWAFSDSLTFGSTAYDSTQKIWKPALAEYEYFFDDTILRNEINYYKFKYVSPIHYQSVQHSDWDNELTPAPSDVNGLLIDLFSISSYANINSVLTARKFPSVSSDVTTGNYVFQLTAKATSASTNDFFMGVIPGFLNDYSSSSTISVPRNYTTLSNASVSNGYMRFSSSAAAANQIHAYNYVISSRGYFSKSLEIVSADGSPLPVYLENGASLKYVSENTPFKVKSEYYDPDGDIDYYEISAYIDSVSDPNKVKKWEFAAGQSGFVSIDQTLTGLVDLTASAPNRTVKIAIRLIDNETGYYEIQSDAITLVQFPYFAGDFTIVPFVSNKKVGYPPKGNIQIHTKDPDGLRGVRFYIWKTITGAPDRSDYNTTFFKDVDFECQGFDCSFNYEITDWLFPDATGAYALTVSAMLDPELEDYNSLKTAKTIYFNVFWKEFGTARILEAIERPGHDYRNDEVIPLVMHLDDADYSNMKNDVEVWITLSSCDAATAGNCTVQDINYKAESFLYDPKTGYNYFFWRNIFIDANGSLLADGNYYRVMGTVSDATGKHQTTIHPYLAPKCQTYQTDCSLLAFGGVSCFFANALAGLNRFLLGCTVQTPAIVTTDNNYAYEGRLLINAGKSLSTPTQECFFCFNNDQNNVYVNQLEQDMLCGAWYTFNEAPIDNFHFYLTNENSDLSKKGSSAQFIEFEVPYTQIIFNDLTLMSQSLNKEYGTQADTIGELIFQFGNWVFTGIANPLVDIPEGLTATGLITNVGADCNFSRALDPTYIDGMIFFKLKGVKVINQQDYSTKYKDLVDVTPANLLEYMNYKGYVYPKNFTNLEVYVSDAVKIKSEAVSSPLVINEPYSETSVKTENVQGSEVQYKTLPSKLRFTAINDLIYNSERNTIRRFVPFTITAVITQMTFSWADSILGGLSVLINSPGQFFVSNWFLIFISAMALLTLAVIFRTFKGSGGSNITINKGG